MAEKLRTTTLSHHDDTLDLRIAEMRQLLAAINPSTTADRLRMLRERFPDIPLRERMQALSTRHS